MLSKIDSHLHSEKLNVDLFAKKQKSDNGGGCSTCCKVIALAIAVFASIALFTFLAPVPALIITACLLLGTGSLWIVPSGPVFTSGYYHTAPLSHRTIGVWPSRAPAVGAPVSGGHTVFGGGHSFGGGMRTASLGGGGFGGGRAGGGGGHVQFGRG